MGLALLAVEGTPSFLSGIFVMSVRTVNETFMPLFAHDCFIVVKKIKQFPILLGYHNSMGENSYAIKMPTILLTPILKILLASQASLIALVINLFFLSYFTPENTCLRTRACKYNLSALGTYFGCEGRVK